MRGQPQVRTMALLSRPSSSSSAIFFGAQSVVALIASHLLMAMALVPNDTVAISSIRYPAVIAFGDSILDTGNNNGLPTILKCNFPPYGQDFPMKQATGRFSNGRVPSDMIASALGLKNLLPPYLNTTDINELLTGVSFASGGTGYDPLTAKMLSLLSMSDQLDLFKDYKRKLLDFAGEVGADWIVSNALYVISGANNDVANTYYSTELAKVEYNNISAYLDFLVSSASDFVKDLHDLGARNIGVMGLPPLGCLPSTRTTAGGPQRGCVDEYNRASLQFNTLLSGELQRLNSKLQGTGTTIVFIDIYASLLDLMLNPIKYGFDEAMKGCCGTGDYEMSVLCNPLSSNVCKNDSTYVFWDSFHPTERAYDILLAKVHSLYPSFFQ